MEQLIELGPLPVFAAVVVTALAACVQGTIGFGFAVVSVPLLALVDPVLVPMPQLFVQLPMTGLILYREREHADWRGATWMTLGRIPGTYVGALLLAVASARALDATIGGLTLFAVVLLSGQRAIPRNTLTESIAGFISGAAAYVSAIGGPPLALLYKNDKGPTVRASLSLVFVIGLVVTIGGRLLDGAVTPLDAWLGLTLIPPMLLGFWFSRFFTGRVEGRPLQVAILLVSALCALGLLGRALFG